MIALERLPKPLKLEQKADAWTRRHLDKLADAEAAGRPSHTIKAPNGQYNHDDVLDQLEAMSHHKCFYCETKLDRSDYTVDHYIEQAVDPTLVFEWENLYLCCEGCQSKLPEGTIPRAECIDPCAVGAEPSRHLEFEDEIIRVRGGSARGRQTIRKYKLDRGDLELRRCRQYKEFMKELRGLETTLRREGRRRLSAGERERLDRYRQPEHPYSAMFAAMWDRLDID